MFYPGKEGKNIGQKRERDRKYFSSLYTDLSLFDKYLILTFSSIVDNINKSGHRLFL